VQFVFGFRIRSWQSLASVDILVSVDPAETKISTEARDCQVLIRQRSAIYRCGYYTVGRLLNVVARSSIAFIPYIGFSTRRCIIMSTANVLLLQTALMSTVFRRVRKVAINDNLLLCLYVRPFAWNNLAPTGRIFLGFDIWVLFDNLSRKFKFDKT